MKKIRNRILDLIHTVLTRGHDWENECPLSKGV